MKEKAITLPTFTFNLKTVNINVVYKEYPRRHRLTPLGGIITTIEVKRWRNEESNNVCKNY